MKTFGSARRRGAGPAVAFASLTLLFMPAGCSLISHFDAPTRDECAEAQKRLFYRDGDGDGFGTSATMADVVRACFAPTGFADRAGDCNDADNTVNPNAQELCDGQDNDCSSGGGADPSEDADRDGHAAITNACLGGNLPKDDCDDTNAAVLPGHAEACDGRDNDCNGMTDENPGADAFCAAAGNVQSTCHGGSCIAACAPGFADCDGNPGNGCEQSILAMTDVDNCGGCGISCGIGGTCDHGFCRAEITSVAAGIQHTCAVRTEGTRSFVVCWGSNMFQQLGVPSVDDSRVPVTVMNVTGATKLASGTYHNCAVANGQVFCWGLNDQDQLGRAGMDPTPQPVAGLTGITDVVASGSHNCALESSGGVQCWGDNRHGQLGTGSTADSEFQPAPVVGLSNVTKIALGGGDLQGSDTTNPADDTGHACAISNGSVVCWGDNREGQLGLMNTTQEDMPAGAVQFPAGVTNVTDIALGYEHSCAATSDQQVYCWGANTDGQLGNGMLVDTPNPSPEAVLLDTVTPVNTAEELIAQGSHACALQPRDTMLCWGDNAYGELGDDALTDSGYAVTVSAMPDAKIMASGWYHTCAVRNSGQLACWGDNESGQLGDGTNARRRAPVRVVGLSSGVRLAGGALNTCGLRADGHVSCWGHEPSINGSTGTDESTDLFLGVPQVVDPMNFRDAVEVVVGEFHACARVRNTTGGDSVKCWGVNDVGQLGPDATAAESAAPVGVSGLTEPVQLSASRDFTCARQADGTVKCWGDNSHRQLGAMTTGTSSATPITPAVTNVFEVAAGANHACVRLGDGTVTCWGDNQKGQLGSMPTMVPSGPTPVAGINDAIQVVAGAHHSCVLHGGGTVSCWGANDAGQLGTGSFGTPAGVSTVRGLDGVVQLAAGDDFTCARRKDATVWCWGRNGFGQLGTGHEQDSGTAAPVSNANNVLEISAGRDYACARERSGDLVCWGRNDVGQLGDETDNDSSLPVVVRSLP